MALLEVVAMNEVDAEAAETGGADRIVAVAERQSGGLSPDPKTVAAMRKTTSLPIRVMLRAKSGFRTTEPELDRLCRAACAHASAGANGFVFGFLHADGTVDLSATARLADAVLPLPWTFHRAIDHTVDPAAAWRAIRVLRGLDSVLCAGSAGGVEPGIDALVRRAARDARLMLVGGRPAAQARGGSRGGRCARLPGRGRRTPGRRGTGARRRRPRPRMARPRRRRRRALIPASHTVGACGFMW